MKRDRLMLKRAAGWFAAGPEFMEALELLSDGAFKLYVYACLQADRYTGRVLLEHARMTGILGRDAERITVHLNELGKRGIFHIDPGLNGGQMALVEIRDRFWPYRKQKRAIGRGSEQAEFIGKVRDLFLTPACVRAVFTAADEAIAGCLYERGITPEQIQRAILLGCARKYVSMINSRTQTRISSLQYFIPLIEEVTESEIPESYWEPLGRKVAQMETRWIQTPCGNKLMPAGSDQL